VTLARRWPARQSAEPEEASGGCSAFGRLLWPWRSRKIHRCLVRCAATSVVVCLMIAGPRFSGPGLTSHQMASTLVRVRMPSRSSARLGIGASSSLRQAWSALRDLRDQDLLWIGKTTCAGAWNRQPDPIGAKPTAQRMRERPPRRDHRWENPWSHPNRSTRLGCRRFSVMRTACPGAKNCRSASIGIAHADALAFRDILRSG